jgi:hypothetical protein
VWRPQPSAGGRVGIGAAAASLLVALAAGWWVTQQPIGLGIFVGLLLAVASLALSILFALWTLGYYTLHYVLAPDGLHVVWLFREDVIPYKAVSALYAGHRLSEPPRVRGVVWPGNYVGRARVRNFGVLTVFATTLERSELTILLTDLGGYVLSAPAEFRTALVERLEAAREDTLPAAGRAGAVRTSLSRAAADRWLVVCLGGALLLLLGMLGAIIARYESLPELLALQLDPLGQPIAMRSRFELFSLPGIGAVVLLVDVALGMLLYEREVLAARLVWTAPVLVQLALATALLRTLLGPP